MQIFRSQDPDFVQRWGQICARGSDEDEASAREAAAQIVAEIRSRGDDALIDLTERYDGWRPASAAALVAGKEDFATAFRELPPGNRRALSLAAERIADFHSRESTCEVPSRRDAVGAVLAQVSRPLARVGLYVPGGTARYPSSVLMTAVPAKVAGVGQIIVCSPAQRPPEGAVPSSVLGAVDRWTLAACHVSGVSQLFKVGGAQAIAAMAYGTATIPAVDKVCGPGNAYVAAAKRHVFGHVDIDMIAGPSEILVVADEAADAKEVASDLIAQAEHDVRAVSVLVTTSAELADRVVVEVAKQLEDLPRNVIARRSLEERGAIVVVGDLAEAIRLANQFAPEHLALLVVKPDRWIGQVENAGAVFLGTSTPEAVGDYVAGPSHVLPTAGTARFASPLSVATFRRRMSVLSLSPEALAALAPAVEALAAAEGLEGHARAVRIRVESQAAERSPRSDKPSASGVEPGVELGATDDDSASVVEAAEGAEPIKSSVKPAKRRSAKPKPKRTEPEEETVEERGGKRGARRGKKAKGGTRSPKKAKRTSRPAKKEKRATRSPKKKETSRSVKKGKGARRSPKKRTARLPKKRARGAKKESRAARSTKKAKRTAQPKRSKKNTSRVASTKRRSKRSSRGR